MAYTRPNTPPEITRPIFLDGRMQEFTLWWEAVSSFLHGVSIHVTNQHSEDRWNESRPHWLDVFNVLRCPKKHGEV